MSWSFNAIGRPDAVRREMDTQNAGLTGQSKLEWDEVKPVLAVLIGMNCGNHVVRISASGHASFEVRTLTRDSEGSPMTTERVQVSGQCSVTLESIFGFVE